MLRIVIPLAGRSRFLKEDQFQVPPPLIEIQGRPMIEWTVRNLDRIKRPKQYLFIVSSSDCRRFALDTVLRILPEGPTLVHALDAPTQGALCSALMLVDHIDDDEPLLIANGDQIFDIDLDTVIDEFDERGLDFGTICFDSVHPRWSFVRLDDQGQIVEAAEKRPISRDAIAGFYYFRHGSDFVRAGQKAIERGVPVGDAYFTSQAINEMILEGKRTGVRKIETTDYHSFYSRERIRDFEQLYPSRMQSLARQWAGAFSERNLAALEELLADGVRFTEDEIGKAEGKPAALEVLRDSFESCSQMRYEVSRVHISGETTLIEFEETRDTKQLRGVDILAWSGGKVASLRRYANPLEN